MAAQAWKPYNRARFYIGNGTLALDGTVFRLALFQSASNFASATLSVIGSLNSEVASTSGYSSSGAALTSEVWTQGQSTGEYKFDAADAVWTALGSDIANIKGAVIYVSGASAGSSYLLCYASLTSTEFDLAAGNTVTIQMNDNGILTLT